MTEKQSTFGPADHLSSGQAIADFMAAAFETNDPACVAHALGVVARVAGVKGMTQIASQTGLSREQLYRSFGRSVTSQAALARPGLNGTGAAGAAVAGCSRQGA